MQALLLVEDLAQAVGFFVEQLGFTSQGQATVVDPEGVVLGLTAAPRAGVARPGAYVYLRQADLPAFAVRLAARGVEVGAVEAPYPGYRQLLVPAPGGYLLAFWEPLPLSDAEILALYRSGPERLTTLFDGLDEGLLDRPRAPGKWTARQILHHVVDAELGTLTVLRQALGFGGGAPPLHPWSGDDWVEQFGGLLAGPAVALLVAVRGWISTLIDETEGALDRSVRWPSGYEAQVRDLLRQVGGHAMGHILQIEEVVGRGPV